MANTGTFRSAINGFNRQDVMDYLESASQRYEALKKERNELDRMRTEQQARVKELESIRRKPQPSKSRLPRRPQKPWPSSVLRRRSARAFALLWKPSPGSGTTPWPGPPRIPPWRKPSAAR